MHKPPHINSIGRVPRILIIDDEAMIRDTLEALLYREGYELLFAINGIDALQRMQVLEPDVILLDVMMPQMTGFELCQLLKNSAEFQHTPIILITALDNQADLLHGLNAGADEFISKPVNGYELRARVRSMLRLKAQFDKLQDTLKLRELLANMLVHDMRNPLTVIQIYTQLLQRSAHLTPEQTKYVSFIHTEAQQLNNFVDDILMLAKLEEGSLVIIRTEVDIGKFILGLEGKYKLLANFQNVDFELIRAMDQPPGIRLDINLFQRVLDNLITNALKFSGPKSKIALCIEYPSQISKQTGLPLLRISVSDEGDGIPAEDSERIFEKQGVIAMKQDGHSQVGLGLVFCRMIVEAHGGRIFVRNNPTRGATFTIEI